MNFVPCARCRRLEKINWCDKCIKNYFILNLSTEKEGWQPMSSAPKDGTPVLTYSFHGGFKVLSYYTEFGRWEPCNFGEQPERWTKIPPLEG